MAATYHPDPEEYITLGGTYYLWFALNDTSGSGADGTSLSAVVREAGASSASVPLLTVTPSLLSDASYPNGCYEVAIDVTTANGFASGKQYAVFVTGTVGSQTPVGFIGRFRT